MCCYKKTVWVTFVLNSGTSYFSLSFTHFIPGSVPHPEARWQMMEMTHQHGFSFSDLFPNISGILRNKKLCTELLKCRLINVGLLHIK